MSSTSFQLFEQTYENKEILSYTMTLAERAAFLEPSSSKYQCELGFLNLQLNRPADAERLTLNVAKFQAQTNQLLINRYFKNATRLNKNDLLGIIGSLRVALINRKSDIFKQISDLEEFHPFQEMPMASRISAKFNQSNNKIQFY